MKISLRQRVLHFVTKSRKPVSITMIAMAVSAYVTAPQIARAFERELRGDLKRNRIVGVRSAKRGLQKLISDIVSCLYRLGLIARIGRGLYK